MAAGYCYWLELPVRSMKFRFMTLLQLFPNSSCLIRTGWHLVDKLSKCRWVVQFYPIFWWFHNSHPNFRRRKRRRRPSWAWRTWAACSWSWPPASPSPASSPASRGTGSPGGGRLPSNWLVFHGGDKKTTILCSALQSGPSGRRKPFVDFKLGVVF